MNVKELLQTVSKSAEFTAAVLSRGYAVYVPELGCAYSSYRELCKDLRGVFDTRDIISITDAELKRVPKEDINNTLIREGEDVAVFNTVFEYDNGDGLEERPLTFIVRRFPVPGIQKCMTVRELVKAVAKANSFYKLVFGKPVGIFDNGLQWIYASYKAFMADVQGFMMWDRSEVTEYMSAECERCVISPGDFPLLINYGEPVAAFRARFFIGSAEEHTSVLYILHPGAGLQKGNGDE